jgi:SPP1 gp7 family putative phage head morphogenesis protein
MIKADYEKQFVSQFEKGVLQTRVTNADARAKLIARDQISKYNGQLNQTRQTALGLSKYRWQTSGDERVRDTHKALNGKIFSWDNPPSVGHPGDEINCRCVALPIFDVGVTENPTLLKLLNS